MLALMTAGSIFNLPHWKMKAYLRLALRWNLISLLICSNLGRKADIEEAVIVKQKDDDNKLLQNRLYVSTEPQKVREKQYELARLRHRANQPAFVQRRF